MKKFRPSRLFPIAWRLEYGAELDEIVSRRKLTLSVLLDVLWAALREWATELAPCWPILPASLVIGFLNRFAKEVQWTAGTLIVFGAAFASLLPNRYWPILATLFLAVPISELTRPHAAPLYQCLVALIPLSLGALTGRGYVALAHLKKEA